jgi:flagellar biogenesis protein FliO
VKSLPPRFRSIAARTALAALPLLLGAGLSALAEETGLPPISVTNRPPVASELPDVTFPLFRVFGALAVVVALFVGGAWLFRNWSGFAGPRGRTARLRMLEMRSLGNRHALFVVGYDQQRLLIASSPAGITLLERLPSEPEFPSPASTDASTDTDPGSAVGGAIGLPHSAPSHRSFAEALRGLLPPR